ncbi:TIM barrel protein [Ignicoccus hospitalis]|uniref:Endonuclease IV n=1 Tax=Ignicoccus hospitalis (strain KIN4/I / DSM 18386 / JCM 14125) TaxID=453591 RepID=A8ABG7_IGNH4|nr:deoxyribonuclease IV [Ignicoccus hospitalis]ABU82269.1 Endonuclease IV [Ignicoccus hospitalis KIN4/I]HIH90812.1 TIM barrel protein [Desulfurococcaceae archaeon]
MPFQIDRLRFGPAGIPNSAKKRNVIEGIKRVKELGLDAMELEFVRGVRMSEEKAREAGKVARELDVVLTAHAPYYVNLASPEEEKRKRSIEYIVQSAKVLHAAGGWSVVFHPGWYMKKAPSVVYKRIRDALAEVVERVKELGLDVWIRPETMELKSKFGSLDEVIKLSQEFDIVLPCVDFAHLRYREGWNSKEEFRAVLEKLEKELGRFALDNMHIHVSGIKLDKHGTHLNLEESDMRWKELLEVLKEFNVKGVLISESPNLEEDAVMMKKYWYQLSIFTPAG